MYSYSETYQRPCGCCVSPGIVGQPCLVVGLLLHAYRVCNRTSPDLFHIISPPIFPISASARLLSKSITRLSRALEGNWIWLIADVNQKAGWRRLRR